MIILKVNLSLRATYKRIMAKGGWDDDLNFFIIVEGKKGRAKTNVFFMNAVLPAVNFRRNKIHCL